MDEMEALRPSEIPEEKENIDNSGVTIGWVLYLVGMFTGIFYIVAYGWAFFKKRDATSEFEKTHYKKMTSMCNISAIITIVGMGFFIFPFYQAISSMNNYNTYQMSSGMGISYLIGISLMFGVYIWNFVRIIKGLSKSSNKKEYI